MPMTIAPGADAVFLPPRENFLEAIEEALQAARPARARLYHDGRRCAWLPRRSAGWFPINSIALKEAA